MRKNLKRRRNLQHLRINAEELENLKFKIDMNSRHPEQSMSMKKKLKRRTLQNMNY